MENENEYTQLSLEERRPLLIQFFKQTIESGTFDKLLREVPDSILFLAANGDIDLEATEMIVRAGFDIHVYSETNQTPLIYALEHNAPNFARALIKLGADATVINEFGESAELEAARIGNEELAIRLRDIAHAQIKEQVNAEYRFSFDELFWKHYRAACARKMSVADFPSLCKPKNPHRAKHRRTTALSFARVYCQHENVCFFCEKTVRRAGGGFSVRFCDWCGAAQRKARHLL